MGGGEKYTWVKEYCDNLALHDVTKSNWGGIGEEQEHKHEHVRERFFKTFIIQILLHKYKW